MIYVMLLLLCVAGITIAYNDELRNSSSMILRNKSIEKRKKDLQFWVMKKNKSRMDRELFQSSVILKNLSLVQGHAPFSADYIYEKLMENSVVLRPVYGQMLTVYRSRKSSEAFKIIPMVIGTKTSKNFAIILSKLEKLNPAELEKQMEVFQKSMMETRMTYAIRRVQRSSLILTALATITVFVLLLNFVVVVVFLNTIETLNQLFV